MDCSHKLCLSVPFINNYPDSNLDIQEDPISELFTVSKAWILQFYAHSLHDTLWVFMWRNFNICIGSFRTPLCYLGCSHSHLIQMIFHMRERQIPEQISIRLKLQKQFLAFQSRRKCCCTPLILYWHSLKCCLPWVKNFVIPFWTVNFPKDFLRLIPIWLPALSIFSSVKR